MKPVSYSYSIDIVTSTISNGDLIFIKGNTIQGTVVRLFEKDTSYSHVGIIVKDGNSVEVIHVSPHGGEKHFICKESFSQFVADKKITDFAIFRVSDDSQSIANACAYEEQCYQDKIPFNDPFSMKSKDFSYTVRNLFGELT